MNFSEHCERLLKKLTASHSARFFLWLFVVSILLLPTTHANPEKTNSISREEIETMTESSAPQEESPFLIEREEARQAAAEAATNSLYRNSLLLPRHSIQQQIKNFAHQFLTIAKITPDKTTLPPLQIFVEPARFSVADTSELDVSFKITNTKKEMLFLEFATNQRIDILVKDSQGNVLTRWSEDRSFEPTPGVVTINPKESVLYTEKIATSQMQDGNTYTLEVSLVGHPGQTLTQLITPQPAIPSDSDEQ